MNIVITGASRGIGYEAAKHFAKVGNNFIFAISRNISRLKQLADECRSINTGSRIIPLQIDIENFVNGADDVYNQICLLTDHIDGLINNAGYLVNKPFIDTSVAESQKILNVNFFGPALLIRELIPLMGKKSSSHVVNIGSMGGFQGSIKYPGLAYYSAAKAALAVLTECLAEEFKDSGIFFNCLALGAVQTEMLNAAFPGYNAPLSAETMAEFIVDFTLKGYKYMNGKILPLALSNP